MHKYDCLPILIETREQHGVLWAVDADSFPCLISGRIRPSVSVLAPGTSVTGNGAYRRRTHMGAKFADGTNPADLVD